MNAVVAPVQEPIRLTELKTAMLLFVPFFASLLLDIMELKVGKFPHIFGDRTPTAATNGKTIWVDQDFLNSLKLPEAVFLICHEIGHTMWEHMARGKNHMDLGFEGQPFDPRVWNIAGDYVINDMLVKSEIGDMPKVGLLDSKYTNDMMVDDVYRELMKDPRNQQSGKDGRGGNGKPDANGNDGSTMDTHILEPAEISSAEMKRAVKTASEAAKAIGKMPAALQRFVDQFLQPQVPWRDKLRFHVTRAVSRETTTWKTPHRRRLLMQKTYLPSYTGYGAGEIVVAVDTSGSIGGREMQVFFSELAHILDDCKPERVYVLGVDAAVNSVEEFDAGYDIKSNPPRVVGGGGTSFIPAFDWCDENGVIPSALVYFTDLCGEAPREEPAYPVIWCCTTDQQGPWGETCKVELDVKEEA